MTRARRRASDVIVALAVLVLIGLGSWQVQRLHWKEALIEERQARLAAPPMFSWEDAAPFRRVRLDGVLLGDRAVKIGMRERFIIPMLLDDGSTVLVDASDRSSGRATVEGYLRESEVGGAFTPPNDPARSQWFTADIPALAAALGLSRVRPFLVETGAPPGIPNDHLQYVITWYSLAVALVVIYLLARRRQVSR